MGYQQTPNKNHIKTACTTLHRLTNSARLDEDDIRTELAKQDCPMSLWGAVNNLTHNLYYEAGHRFDKAGQPEDMGAFNHYGDDAVNWVWMFYNHEVDEADLPTIDRK